jgi:hypothetical protein
MRLHGTIPVGEWGSEMSWRIGNCHTVKIGGKSIKWYAKRGQLGNGELKGKNALR